MKTKHPFSTPLCRGIINRAARAIAGVIGQAVRAIIAQLRRICGGGLFL